MNVELFSNILFYGIKRNPVTVFLSVDMNMFHGGWQSTLLLIFRRKISCTWQNDLVFLKACLPAKC